MPKETMPLERHNPQTTGTQLVAYIVVELVFWWPYLYMHLDECIYKKTLDRYVYIDI